MATAEQTLELFGQLTPEEKQNVAKVVVQALPPPSPPTANNLWYIVVGTFSALLLGGLIILPVLILKGKSTEVISPLVTLAAGVLGGLLAPSPAPSTT